MCWFFKHVYIIIVLPFSTQASWFLRHFCSAEIFATSLYQGRNLFAHLLFHLESMFCMLFRLQSRISATWLSAEYAATKGGKKEEHIFVCTSGGLSDTTERHPDPATSSTPIESWLLTQLTWCNIGPSCILEFLTNVAMSSYVFRSPHGGLRDS